MTAWGWSVTVAYAELIIAREMIQPHAVMSRAAEIGKKTQAGNSGAVPDLACFS